MPEFIKTEIRQGVAHVMLDRPAKRNALTRLFIGELSEFVEQVRTDLSIRLLVLEANGDVFCAGMDLGEMQSRAAAADPEKEWQTDSDVYNGLVASLFDLKIPTLAVLPGPVLAGGTGMVFACDMVLASDNAFISLPEPKRGIVAAMVCPLLVYRAGASIASYMLMSGKTMSAEKAQTLGVFHEVVAKDELESAKTSLIQSILTGSNTALQMTKSHLRTVTGVDMLQQIKDSTNVSAEARRSDDAQEGLAAFMEKRRPNWDPELK